MAGKKSTAGKKKFVFKGFENLVFSEEQRHKIVKWFDAFDEDGVSASVVLVEAGYKVGLSYDDHHGVTQATLTCKDEGSKYFGWCFTLRHSDLNKALLLLRYVYDAWLKSEIYEIETFKDDFDW